jgi:cation diffusion facilitator family transporter
VIIHFTGWFYVDAVIGIGIAIFIIYSAWELIEKGYLLLLDAALEDEDIDKITDIIKKQALVTSFHELKTRQSGHTKFVEVHLVFTPEIKLIDAHRISDHIEFTIPRIDTMSDWKVMIHMDPYDDSEFDKH